MNDDKEKLSSALCEAFNNQNKRGTPHLPQSKNTAAANSKRSDVLDPRIGHPQRVQYQGGGGNRKYPNTSKGHSFEARPNNEHHSSAIDHQPRMASRDVERYWDLIHHTVSAGKPFYLTPSERVLWLEIWTAAASNARGSTESLLKAYLSLPSIAANVIPAEFVVPVLCRVVTALVSSQQSN